MIGLQRTVLLYWGPRLPFLILKNSFNCFHYRRAIFPSPFSHYAHLDAFKVPSYRARHYWVKLEETCHQAPVVESSNLDKLQQFLVVGIMLNIDIEYGLSCTDENSF